MNKNVKNFMELDIRVGKIISAEEFPEIKNLLIREKDANSKLTTLQFHPCVLSTEIGITRG